MSEISSLSILIPVYNCDVRAFVNDLHNQCLQEKTEFEILCFDDFSAESFKITNRSLSGLANVQYRELERNYGRSAIRNILAANAAFHNLLFLDCDGKVISEDFIRKYVRTEYAPVKIGGRVYSPAPPADPDFYLHWLAGTKKEVFPASQRQKHPYESLMLNNILINKDVFMRIRLDENLEGYGHEDSLFGFELQKAEVKILHIDNPVQHLQLDNNTAFLNKSEEAVRNFAWMLKNKGLGKNTRLYRTYIRMSQTKLLTLFTWFMVVCRNRARKNLLGKKPDLIWLDLLKLNWLRNELKKQN
jgi:glycosyltransferase involved in cell wall biosynthesis